MLRRFWNAVSVSSSHVQMAMDMACALVGGTTRADTLLLASAELASTLKKEPLKRETMMKEYESIEPRYVQAVQVGKNVTDIYNIPGCTSVEKNITKGNVFWFGAVQATEGDWIVDKGEGKYTILPDEAFRKMYKPK
jgi:hypothetical protein